MLLNGHLKCSQMHKKVNLKILKSIQKGFHAQTAGII